MGKIKEPIPVKLVVAMLSGDPDCFGRAESHLEQLHGPIDYSSVTLPFDHTHYYEPEFGAGLQRRFISFRDLIDPGSLAQIKVQTNAVEQGLMVDGRRRINLDPGYVSLGKLVLATTKNRSHRIYIGRGIYAEVTLRYENKCYRPWDCTYPDYRQATHLRILEEIRDLYSAQSRELRVELPRSGS